MATDTISATPDTAQAGPLRLYLCAFATVLLAECIGIVNIPIGAGKIVLLPMIWALLIAAAAGLAARHLPAPLRIDTALQHRASAIVGLALLLFVAKLGLLVGGALPKLATAGWSLAFQEAGHFFGTMLIGLPLALLLGIKREAIGATFSVGREPSLAIIGEKFGMDSPEGRGVLAEYLTGTLFGAIFIALLAGLIASLKVFDPLALAMGAGVGSGSIMAAASGAIAVQQTPEVAKEVATFAAASNLITTTIGTYFTLFLSLPFTVWAYRRLEPLIGRSTGASSPPPAADTPLHPADQASEPGNLGRVLVWLLVGTFALAGNWITYKTAPDADALAGMAIIIGVVLAGYALYRVTRAQIIAVVWVSLVGMALTNPGFAGAATVAALTGKINFLTLTTPILAFAGLSIAKDMAAFRRLGWRIVVVSFAANAGSFVGAALIAQFLMHRPA
jgi:hypothetical protein